MILEDNLFTKDQARERMISGIRKCRDAVGGTMGSAGWNAVIEAIERPGFMNTNDGWQILNSIRFKDPLEELGRKILVEAVDRANKANGDGSSGTTVMTAAILEEGEKYIGKISPIELKHQLEDCIVLIEDAIKQQAREITVDNVGDVCAISAESAEIGKLIQEIYQKIGPDGIIHWDLSKTTEDTYTIGNGLTIHGATYVSPYMCDMDEKTGQFTPEVRWKNAHILLLKQKVTSAAEFDSLFATLFGNDIKEIVVFIDEIEAPVIADLIKTRAIRGFKTLVIKMPVLWKGEWYEDLALATGARVVDPVLGLSLKQVTPEHLGKVGNIIVTKEDTFIDGLQDMNVHIMNLLSEGTDESALRASRLNTKTARLFIGAHSESALSYKRFKVEDAISAGYQALHGGIVAGGGSALACIKLPGTIGGAILEKALKAPAKQIATNAGYPDVVIDENYTAERGFNAKTKEFVNMFDARIVDPANIILNACRQAISVAASALTAHTIVMLPKEEQKPIMPFMR